MKKASLVVHQRYIDDVIKNLHESGMMEIINISKENPETLKEFGQGSSHPDAETCTISRFACRAFIKPPSIKSRPMADKP